MRKRALVLEQTGRGKANCLSWVLGSLRGPEAMLFALDPQFTGQSPSTRQHPAARARALATYVQSASRPRPTRSRRGGELLAAGLLNRARLPDPGSPDAQRGHRRGSGSCRPTSISTIRRRSTADCADRRVGNEGNTDQEAQFR